LSDSFLIPSEQLIFQLSRGENRNDNDVYFVLDQQAQLHLDFYSASWLKQNWE